MLSIVLAAALLASPQIINRPRRVEGPPDQAPPSHTIRGTLRTMDEKSMVVEGADQRIITVSFTEKTFFVQAGRGIARSEFQAGDSLEIEALQDRESRYQAMIVKLLGRGQARAPADPATQPRAAAKAATVGDDEGPPVLRRGAPPARPSRPVLVDKTAEAPVPAPVPERPAPPANPRMALLEQAREAAGSFIESLPNYLCQQVTTRSVARVRDRWEAVDVVTANVVYENKQESYRDIKVNGKPVGKNMMEIGGGATSTGEFGTILIGLFHPGTRTDFQFSKNTTASGRAAADYDFSVARENSTWHISVPGQEIVPAYRGAVWIDKETARVLRIEMEAAGIPKAFPMDHVETAVDYAPVRLETQTYLLPVHAENLMCERDSSICSKNVIDFRNYRKFGADSKITFDPK